MFPILHGKAAGSKQHASATWQAARASKALRRLAGACALKLDDQKAGRMRLTKQVYDFSSLWLP
jgi:hypothetical protein